jgi:glycosyltransferase involved in cell wall biosynthesis
MRQDPIAVVTLTRGRPELLRRAMASVFAQDYDGEIEHVVVIDDDPDQVAVVNAAPTRPGLKVVAHPVPRPPAERVAVPGDRRTVYPRLSRLFNTGVRVASSTWIAFLDDDNEFEAGHLSSLMACAEANGARAVHSGRRMFWADGEPYLSEIFPSAPTPEEGARIFELMCDRGIWIRGTNILLDRVDPVQTSYRNSTVLGPDDPIFLVDQSVWLLRRDLLLELPIPEHFTDAEIDDNTCPDDKLLEVLVRNGVSIFSTKLPSVRYYLGGVSNDHQP